MTNNELIAEFIGFQKTNLGWFDNEETMNFKSDGNTYDSYELKFHSSWDWLMPVMDKISAIKNWSINATFEWLSASEFNIQQESDGFYTIEDVYLAVVEFIKRTKKST